MSLRGKQNNHHSRKNNKNTIHHRQTRTREQNRRDSYRRGRQARPIRRPPILGRSSNYHTPFNHNQHNNMKRQQPRSDIKRASTVKTRTDGKTHYHQCTAHTINPESRSEYRTREDHIATEKTVDGETLMFCRRRNAQVDRLVQAYA